MIMEVSTFVIAVVAVIGLIFVTVERSMEANRKISVWRVTRDTEFTNDLLSGIFDSTKFEVFKSDARRRRIVCKNWIIAFFGGEPK